VLVLRPDDAQDVMLYSAQRPAFARCVARACAGVPIKAGAADRGPSLTPEFLSFVPGALIAPSDRGITAIQLAAVAARELR
jgi:hypothetical protein